MRNRVVSAFFGFATLLLGVGGAWAQNELFVTNAGNNSVTVYARTANGNVAPVRTIAGASTGLNAPGGVAVDAVNSEVSVVNSFGSVTVYALTANGDVAPLRTIAGGNTGLGANGNVAPLRTIAGAATGLNAPFDVTVDTVNNEVAVANAGDGLVLVFSRTANGNVAPLRTLAGVATGLTLPVGLEIDTVNNELFVVNQPTNSISAFARTANAA